MDYLAPDALMLPLLEEIANLGGYIVVTAEGDEVCEALADRFRLPAAAPGWREHVHLVRLKLVDAGYVLSAKEGGCGLWVMTDEGYTTIGQVRPKPPPAPTKDLDPALRA
jgi:hypothetical protein